MKSTPDNSITSLVYGEPYIYESLLGNEFRLSPDSFFQVNVKAAEIMHEEVAKLAKLTSTTTLLDLCCGVGESFQYTLPILRENSESNFLTYFLLII